MKISLAFAALAATILHGAPPVAEAAAPGGNPSVFIILSLHEYGGGFGFDILIGTARYDDGLRLCVIDVVEFGGGGGGGGRVTFGLPDLKRNLRGLAGKGGGGNDTLDGGGGGNDTLDGGDCAAAANGKSLCFEDSDPNTCGLVLASWEDAANNAIETRCGGGSIVIHDRVISGGGNATSVLHLNCDEPVD